MDFVTLDFETATSKRASACELGITVVKSGLIKRAGGNRPSDRDLIRDRFFKNLKD